MRIGVRTLAPVVLLLWQPWLAGPGLAHLPAIFGKDYVRLNARELLPVIPPSPFTASRGSESPYRDEMDSQAWLGPYSEGLSDPLIGLGHHYRREGDPEGAAKAYRHALHVIRVNDGLSSERQLPILRALLDIYRETGDLEALDSLYGYHHRLHGSGLPPYSADRVAASLEYIQWCRDAFLFRVDGESVTHLLEGFLLNDRMLTQVADGEAISSEQDQELVGSQMANLYLLLGEDHIEDDVVGIPTGTMHKVQMRDEYQVRRRLAVIQGAGVKLGQRLLEGYLARNPELDLHDRAAVYLELGDWLQYNGELRKARVEYARVENLLLDAGEQELLQSWLGEPVELPDESKLWQSSLPVTANRPVEVRALYDVSARGNVSNIEVEVPDPADADQGVRLKRMLRETHFRPRFAGGEPQAMSRVERRYQVLD